MLNPLTIMDYDWSTFRGDLFGGITSAVVSLPVALAFGVASGLGAQAGIYGAIGVGLFATVFGGTRPQVSGPTGAITVTIAVIVTSRAESPTEAFTIAILAGLIQMSLGTLRIGRFVFFIPYSVISGFMSGIGLIVILLHTLPFLGAPTPTGDVGNVIQAWPQAVRNIEFNALAIAAVTLLVGIFWPDSVRRFVPPVLAALIVGTLLSVFWLQDTPVIGEIPMGLPKLQLPDFSVQVLVRSMQPAIIIALLGSVESLLTSLIADSMTRTQHDPNQELVGQGIGNIVAGLIGGMPGGATSTIVNVQAGGRTQVSGTIRTLILLTLLLGLGGYVALIPHAVLAGIMIKVGWDVIDWRFLSRILHVQREHLVVLVITLMFTVFLDMVTAVAIGLIASGMASARQFQRLELDRVVSVPLLDQSFLGRQDTEQPSNAFSARVGLLKLRGSFTIASAHKLVKIVGLDIQQHEILIFDLSETLYLDDSAALVVEQLIETGIAEDTKFIVLGLRGQPAITMNGLQILQHIPPHHQVESLDEAREVALQILDSKSFPNS